MAVNLGDAGLLSSKRPLRHHHTVTLDDALAHIHHMRLRIHVRLNPDNLFWSQGDEPIASGTRRRVNSGTERKRSATTSGVLVSTNT